MMSPGKVISWLVGAAIVAIAAGALGWWQWSRAHERGVVVLSDPAVPLTELLAPATAPDDALGRTVTVSGVWGAGRIVVLEREINDIPAEILLRELTVTGVAVDGGDATLVVLVGWATPGEIDMVPDLVGEAVDVDGWLRLSEAPTPGDASISESPYVGVGATRAISAAELAQVWPGPLYAAILVADDGGDWRTLDPPEPETRLDLQSAAYAIEWWLVGVFAVFIAARAVRENSRGDTGGDMAVAAEEGDGDGEERD